MFAKLAPETIQSAAIEVVVSRIVEGKFTIVSIIGCVVLETQLETFEAVSIIVVGRLTTGATMLLPIQLN